MVRVGMHFHHHAIGARGHGGPSHRSHHVPAAGPVRWVRHNRQVRQLLHYRNGRYIHRVSRERLERADAALTKNHIVVTAGHNVLGREQQFLDGRCNSTFQQNRLAQLAEFPQQIEVVDRPREDPAAQREAVAAGRFTRIAIVVAVAVDDEALQRLVRLTQRRLPHLAQGYVDVLRRLYIIGHGHHVAARRIRCIEHHRGQCNLDHLTSLRFGCGGL